MQGAINLGEKFNPDYTLEKQSCELEKICTHVHVCECALLGNFEFTEMLNFCVHIQKSNSSKIYGFTFIFSLFL